MIISILGYPCSGKSTLARALEDKLSLFVRSTGDLVRHYAQQETNGITDKDLTQFRNRDLSEEYNSRIMSQVRTDVREIGNLILDGYPRSLEQLEDLHKVSDCPIFIAYLQRNALDVLANAKNVDRKRLDDDVEVIKGRIEASIKLKSTILNRITGENGLTAVGFKEYNFESLRASDVIVDVFKFMLKFQVKESKDNV